MPTSTEASARVTVHLHKVSLSDSLLERMAHALWERRSENELADCLVILPSSRACRTLESILFEKVKQPALLLPRTQTLAQWAAGMGVQLGLGGGGLPDERLRPLALAPLLADQSWLKDHPENAVGLAKEFISLFDQVRLEECGEVLLADPAQGYPDDLLGSGAEADTVAADIQRVREVWHLFRQVIPRDGTDELVDLAARFQRKDFTAPVSEAPVFAGGFGRLTRVQAQLLKAALQTSQQAHYYFPWLDSALDKAICATWSAAPLAQRTDPLSPTARLVERLAQLGCFEGDDALEFTEVQPDTGTTIKRRLAAVKAEGEPVNPQGRVTLLPCPDPETESRKVVDLVVEQLSANTSTAGTVTVATPDPLLAARVLAMLHEAGIEADNTLGSPLGSLPAGLLTRFILRAALTDLRAEPLLEVLTHPFVALPTKQGHHQLWTLRLERMFRRHQGPQSGLVGLSRRAKERDQVVQELCGRDDPGMVAFVGEVAAAFEPLLATRTAQTRTWAQHVAAMRATGQALTRGRSSDGSPPRQDQQVMDELWDVLSRDTTAYPPVNLADFATAINRLLAEEMVAPFRPRDLPVMVTGLVEARLEKMEYLILAGLRDDVFPGRPPRQVLLTPQLLGKLGLPSWREHLGREAELFLRLLHNAKRVTVTWPWEDVGKKFLPSPLISRLELALKVDAIPPATPIADVPIWRKVAPEEGPIVAAQASFQAEMDPVAAMAEARPQRKLSWSALRMWQECPYRFLLERRFALTGEDDLRKEFSRLDYGSLVHGVMQDFLTPNSPGRMALATGNEAGALAALDEAAVARFSPGAEELPVRRLWLDSFRRAMPSIVETESERSLTWQPLLLEQKFVLPLPHLVSWTQELCKHLDCAQEMAPSVGWQAAVEQGAEVLLRGTVDRLDVHAEQPNTVAVLDYKTGKLPTAKKVQELTELQVVLYAAATEAGVVADGMQDVKVDEGAYYEIGEGKSGPPAKVHLPGKTPEGRRLLLAGSLRLIDLALAAADPAAQYPLLAAAGEDGAGKNLPCKYCDLRGICRLEEMKNTLKPEVWLGVNRIIHEREGAY